MSLILLSMMIAAWTPGAVEMDLATVTQTVKQPPKEYTTGPLWVWNDLLTKEQVQATLNDLADQGVLQVWVHPRPGLMTPYLSDEWFARWQDALETARQRGMLVWIYDENSYPSGFAGGNVPELMPESRAIGLNLSPEDKITPGPDLYAVYRKTEGGYENITEEVKAKNAEMKGDFLVARVENMEPSPWYGGKTFVDLLHPGVTEKFLELTLDAYRNKVGDEFGKLIPGSFTDEPHLKPCGDLHWTPDFADRYRDRWNEDFQAGLPRLREDSEAGRSFRYRYLKVLSDLFVDRWAKPYYEYCQKAGLEFTGHYWEHSWPECASVPDNMVMGSWQHRPGIDMLFNQYKEDVHAQFGNVRSVIELASVANQMGRQRTLCETYGGSGAEMTFEDYKRIGDWVSVLGVNTINQHLSDVTLRGARKRDYPPTFSYHSPWMACYRESADYFTRVSYAISQGKQINPCLVLEPTTTMWMYNFIESEYLDKQAEKFQALVVNLAKNQIEFDLGSENILEAVGSVEKNEEGKPALKIGERMYSLVVIPAEMENLNRATFELLSKYLKAGGLIYAASASDPPAYLDGRKDKALESLHREKGWTPVAPEALVEKIAETCKLPTRVVLAPESKGITFHQRRQLDNGEILFITNTSNDVVSQGVVETQYPGFREIDLHTGEVRAYAFEKKDDGQYAATFHLSPCGSLMLLIDKTPVTAAPAMTPMTARTPVPVGPMAVQRMDDNNLILDYVDIKAGKEEASGLFWQRAADISFQQNGLKESLWDHAIQFRDDLLKTPFAPDSGFEAAYHFTIEESVPETLFAVVERPDIYTITLNGTPVSATPGSWWLDRSFGKIDIAKIARVGENTLTIKASPMNVFHELEAAHIVGDFSLKSAKKGFTIIPSKKIAFGPWNRQGLPLYGHRVAYTGKINVKDAAAQRYMLRLPSWKGVVAEVKVNDQPAGYIYGQPSECELTASLKTGENEIAVIVYGSLRNTLGPHLGDKGIGLTHPGSWSDAPEKDQPEGKEYFSMSYGLLKPFEVYQAAK